MTVYHPEQRLLNDYAAGNLAAAEAVCINAHLEQCMYCQQQLRSLNRLGAELMENLSPATVSAELFDKLMDRVDAQEGVQKVKTPLHGFSAASASSESSSRVPRALHKLVPDGYESLRWRHLGADLQVARLPATDHSHKLVLYRIQPGGRIAEHGHYGSEITVVLKGAFSDHSGVYRQGDFLYCDENDVHRPMATQDGECICLAAETAPIRFTAWPARILNPFLRLGQLV
jgi:putative transcriptional regulator